MGTLVRPAPFPTKLFAYTFPNTFILLSTSTFPETSTRPETTSSAVEYTLHGDVLPIVGWFELVQ